MCFCVCIMSHSPFVRRTAIAQSSSWSQIETRPLCRSIWVKKYVISPFQPVIDTEFTPDMTALLSDSHCSILVVAFLDVKLTSCLDPRGSLRLSENYLCAEKQKCSWWTKIKIQHYTKSIPFRSHARFSWSVHADSNECIHFALRVENETSSSYKSHWASGACPLTYVKLRLLPPHVTIGG